jgi:large subunit ribosomal protein L35
MGKLRTNKSMAKRFKATGTGELKYSKPGKRHLNAKKTVQRKKRIAKNPLLAKASRKYVVKLLPGVSIK